MIEDKNKDDPAFKIPDEGKVDLKKQVASDYCAYIAYHEQRKELEEKQVRKRGYKPLSRRFRGRRVF